MTNKVNEWAVHRYAIYLCDACIQGIGQQCHSPGCALFLNRCPDIPVHVLPYGLCAQIDTIEEIDEYFAEPQP